MTKKPMIVNKPPPKLWSDCPTCKEFPQLKEKLALAVKALEFYAQYENAYHFPVFPEDTTIGMVVSDRGNIARQALEKI